MVEGTELLGRYRIESKLATGGMGTVFVAEDRRLRRKVATKLLKENLAHDAKFVERFRREARAAAGLSHVNIAGVFDYGEDEGLHFIVMELVEGRDLARILKDEAPFSIERASRIAMQICDALEHAHAAGVVHRDIKPANIIVGAGDFVKVTDFGIARAVGDAAITATGLVLGTAQYISPEQANGRPIGPPSDIYSLGVVLYETLTGDLPFGGDSALAIAMRHVSENVPPPSSVNPSAAPLDEITLQATSKDPQARPDAAALRAALAAAVTAPPEEAAAGAGATAVLSAPTLPEMPAAATTDPLRGVPPRQGWMRDRFPRTALAAVALLCLIAAALAVIAFSSSDEGGLSAEERRARRRAAARRAEQQKERQAPALVTSQPPLEPAIIPEEIIGEPAKAAAKLLAPLGVIPQPVYVASEDAAAGLVVATDPEPGSLVSSGDTVTVYVGDGNVEEPQEEDHSGPGHGKELEPPGKAKGKKDD